jgi:hypothetical protein
MDTNYASDNVIKIITKNSLKGERAINQDHLYTIVHSAIFDCNPHTKVKYKNMEAISKVEGDTTIIFVPTTATKPIDMPSTSKVILDIRSFEGKGSILFEIFGNFIGNFSMKAVTALDEKGIIYMDRKGITDAEDKIVKSAKAPIRNMTVILDRYTLCELDEYCTMLLAYFYKNYKVNGEPHKMHKFIFKPIRIGKEGEKINICVPVLRLMY